MQHEYSTKVRTMTSIECYKNASLRCIKIAVRGPECPFSKLLNISGNGTHIARHFLCKNYQLQLFYFFPSLQGKSSPLRSVDFFLRHKRLQAFSIEYVTNEEGRWEPDCISSCRKQPQIDAKFRQQ